jgi:hypothetical protein
VASAGDKGAPTKAGAKPGTGTSHGGGGQRANGSAPRGGSGAAEVVRLPEPREAHSPLHVRRALQRQRTSETLVASSAEEWLAAEVVFTAELRATNEEHEAALALLVGLDHVGAAVAKGEEVAVVRASHDTAARGTVLSELFEAARPPPSVRD